MSDMRVLVTGSTGCIGSHAVRILLDEGARVFGFNRSMPEDALSENYRHLTGDLSDPESVSLAVKEVQPTHVLHLGAQTRSEEQNPIFELCPEWGVSQYYISESIL